MTLQNKKVILYDLGLTSYKNVWDLQESLLQHIIDQKVKNRTLAKPVPTNNYLILTQHKPVYTLGKTGNKSNLLINEEELQRQAIEYYHINRGGDITFHGPGQLVGYPIFDLENFYTDIHRYLRELEEVIIQSLAHWGLKGYRVEGRTGVWVNDKKICAMGVRTSRWVTMHGFALNVHTDLNYFKNIVPCGISDKDVTSLSHELGYEVNIPEVMPFVLKSFSDIFNIQFVTENEV